MNPADAKFSLEYRASYRFSIISALTVRSLSPLYHKHGLTVGGWRTLSFIGRYEPVFPGRIADYSSISPDKVTRAVDRLVTKGFVARRMDKSDRRRVVLTLTARGRPVYAELELARREAEVRLLGVLSKAELANFHALVDKLEAQARRVFALEPPAAARKRPARR